MTSELEFYQNLVVQPPLPGTEVMLGQHGTPQRSSLRRRASAHFTDTDPLSAALLTDHEAPVEAAVTALTACLPKDVVAAAAAHAAATVGARAALVAQAAHGARRVQARLPLAEVRRLLEVDPGRRGWRGARGPGRRGGRRSAPQDRAPAVRCCGCAGG